MGKILLGYSVVLALVDYPLVFVKEMVVVWVLLEMGWVGLAGNLLGVLEVLGGGLQVQVAQVFYVLVVIPRGG